MTKHYLQILPIILLFTSSISKADDYVWGEEFQEGDVISAETFNQIFSTLQKLNRTPKDSDLVGTWSCSSVWAGTSTSAGLTQDSTNTWLFSLAGAQLTMTASSESTSFPTGYTFSTSSPNPFVSLSSAAAVSGTYILFNNLMISKGILSGNNYISHTIDIVSDDRIIFSTNNTSPNLAKVIVCDSAIAVPAAPTAATATNNQTAVTVAWTDQSSDETGFKIYRRLSTETEATQLATDVTASPYVDSTLTEGQTAYYSVAAYNDNGVSAKSTVVVATLDSIKPTVSSHVPTTNQQVAITDRNLSITFSETVKVICPAGGNGPACSAAGSAITAVGTSGKTYGYGDILPDVIAVVGSTGLVLSGFLVESAETLNASDTITVTVHKEWLQDMNGNQMAADYSWSHTTP